MISEVALRARWRRAAVEVGVIVAPAGLNYVVPSTTYWIYGDEPGARVTTDALDIRTTGLRVALDVEGVTQHLAALRIVDALWARVPLPVSPRWPHGFQALIRQVAVQPALFDLGRFLHRTAVTLDWLGLFAGYADRGLYHADFANGLTFLLVRRTPPRPRGPRRPRRR